MPCLMKTWSRLSSVIYGRNECRLKRVTGGGPALPRISQQQFNKQNPGGAIGGGSIVPTPDSCKAANSIILHSASLSLWPKTWRRSTTPHLPSQRATKGRKSGPFGVYRKVLADRVAAKSFSKYEIVKGIACPGLHRQRRCDIIAR